MNRRRFVTSAVSAPILGVALPFAAPAAVNAQSIEALRIPKDHPLQDSWARWKALCLSPEGRIIDGFQQSASHSEGQGYGLTLAALFGDALACEKIIAWTEANLSVRDDALLAWRWLPDMRPHVKDRNNASDGDVFYAWGLLLAADLAEAEARRERAARIAKDLVRLCIIEAPGGQGPILMPGAQGFNKPEGVMVNPSYYMPAAMHALASATGQIELSRAAMVGHHLLEALARHGPIPDWIMLSADGYKAPPAPFSDRSGYEAMRVPLFQLWSGQGESALARQFAQRANAQTNEAGVPTVLSADGNRVIERSLHPGYGAIAALSDCASSGAIGSLMPAFTDDQPYYPATLHLMALVVQVTHYPRCVPI